MTTNDLLSQYLSETRRIKPMTISLTERAFDYLGNLDVETFGYQQAEGFQTRLIDRGLSKASANCFIKHAAVVFRWARRQGRIQHEPFKYLRLFRVPQKRIRIYEHYEVEAILATASKFWKARILLAYTTGLRRGEVLNLTIGDVDFRRGLLYVQSKKDSSRTWPWEPKDYETRTLPMVDFLANTLTDLLLDLPEGQPYFTIAPQRYGHLIWLKSMGKLKVRLMNCPDENFAKPFKRILKRACVRDGTFHDLRRTWCTNLMENGLTAHEVMKLSGHSSVETLMKSYVTTRSNLLTKARAVIGATGLEPATS